MMCVIRNRPFRRVGDTFRDAGVMQTAAEGGVKVTFHLFHIYSAEAQFNDKPAPHVTRRAAGP